MFKCLQFLDVVSNTFPSASAKVLFGVFLLVLEVCFDYYTSIFTSFLTVYTVKMPFETLEELMDSDYTIGVVNGTSHHDIIKVTIFHDHYFSFVDSSVVREVGSNVLCTYK